MNQKKYYLQLLIICIGTLFLSYELAKLNTPYLLTSHYWIPTLFFLSTTFLINKLLTNGDKASKEFVFKTLAMSMARLLGCMIVVFIYSLVNKNSFPPCFNVISFFKLLNSRTIPAGSNLKLFTVFASKGKANCPVA